MAKQTTQKSTPAQRRLSLAVMGVLTLAAAGILLQQGAFNPAVVAFQQAAAHKAAAIAPSSGAGRSEALLTLPEGFTVLSPAQRFDAETLSDKIDGKAELYLSTGFRQLAAQRVAPPGAPGKWMELFIYDMQNRANAFAVYSQQRREGAAPLDFVPSAYRAANALCFVQGPYYVEIIASAADDATAAAMQRLAGKFVDLNPVQMDRLPEKALFPGAGLESDSITLLASDAFGFERLDHVFTARYAVDGGQATAFVSSRADRTEAASLAAAYREFLVAFGGRVLPDPAAPKGFILVEIMDRFDLIFSQGSVLAGVHEAPDRRSALQLADRLSKHFREAGVAAQP